jgi:hypothetical protein
MASAASLTKLKAVCKAFVVLMTLAPGLVWAGNPPASDRQSLRECIAQSANVSAVASCERAQQRALASRIEQLTTSIRNRLPAQQRPAFSRNIRAWQAFFDAERKLLEFSLAARPDGLGGKLLPGAVSLLYEQRERQLREHLHNLSLHR